MEAVAATSSTARRTSRQREYQRREPEKTAARRALRDAVAAGTVSKPAACEACGEPRALHGHHSDYARPLAVAWLCAPCHGREHAMLRSETAAGYRGAAKAAGTKANGPDRRRVGSRRRAILSRFSAARGLAAVRGRLLLAIVMPVDEAWPVPVTERLWDIRRSTSLPPEARGWLEELVATFR